MGFFQDVLNTVTGGIGSLPDAVINIAKGLGLVKSADDEIKLRQPLLDLQMKLEEETSKQLETVNATMREEAKSEKWPQYSWRPAIGFAVAIQCIGLGLAFSLIIGRVAFGYGLPGDAVSQLAEVLQAMAPLFAVEGAILGVTTWFRGKTKLETAKANGNSNS